MSGPQAPSVASSVWPRIGGPPVPGAYPLSSPPTNLPVVNNSNLPQGLGMNLGNLPSPSYPTMQQGFNAGNGVNPYNYALGNNLPGPSIVGICHGSHLFNLSFSVTEPNQKASK
jgi:hypothetical protein